MPIRNWITPCWGRVSCQTLCSCKIWLNVCFIFFYDHLIYEVRNWNFWMIGCLSEWTICLYRSFNQILIAYYELLMQKSIYIPTPTWGNHPKVFSLGGLEVKNYRYYNPRTRGLDYEGRNPFIGMKQENHQSIPCCGFTRITWSVSNNC